MRLDATAVTAVTDTPAVAVQSFAERPIAAICEGGQNGVVGGLVSAVVVAELAITATGDAPAGRTFAPAATVGEGGTASAGPRPLAIIYVFVWLARSRRPAVRTDGL